MKLKRNMTKKYGERKWKSHDETVLRRAGTSVKKRQKDLEFDPIEVIPEEEFSGSEN